MKRSEMVEKIYKVLLHTRTPVQGIRITNSPADRKIADTILNEIEEAGMLPPYLKTVETTPDGMYLTEDIREDDVYEWEPEDEG